LQENTDVTRFTIEVAEVPYGIQSSASQPRATFSGVTGLIVAVAVVAILLISFPAYRWFFLISLGIGLIVAAILFLWHKFRPIREEDVHNKRPLGLG
jgi:fatty acid desaturase